MIVVNPNGTVDPIFIGPIEVRLSPDPAPISPRSAWIAVAYGPGSARVILDGWGRMPDDALNDLRAKLPAFRDALVLACMDVASLPGCGGVEMMGLEAEAAE